MADMNKAARRVLDQLAATAAQSTQPPHPRGDAEWVAAYRDQILQMRQFNASAAALPPAERFHIEGPDAPLDLRCYHRPALAHPASSSSTAAASSPARSTRMTWPTAPSPKPPAPQSSPSTNRRPPEHPFPAAVEDCYATADHVAHHADTFGIDPASLFVLGDSAGGSLAACVAIMARDRATPTLAGQICLYPNTDLRVDRHYPSMAEHDGTVVKLDELHRCLRLYLAGADPAHPHASPVLAALDGLPPALVITCEFDPLRDEGDAYAAALDRAGNRVTHLRLPGTIHGLLQMADALPDAQTMLDAIATWLRQPPATPHPMPR